MDDDILLRFLTAGLINVGGDDTKLEKLRGTAADIASVLKKSPAKAASFALVAFDSDVPASEPVVRETIEALKKRWPTYVNTFSGIPVTVVRAMLLEALTQAGTEDDKISVALVTSARNVLPFTEAGAERALWVNVVNDIERRLDARAESEWSTPSSIAIAPFDAPAIPTFDTKISSKRIAKDALREKIAAATGPQNKAGEQTNGNPYWPNSPPHWAHEFSERMADALSQTIDSAVGAMSIAPIDLTTPLQSFSSTVAEHIQEAVNAFARATAGLQRRTNLLWWKEALFSPSAQLSYRQLSIWHAAALMAFDLHRQVPLFSPASVAAFLSEAVMMLPQEKDQQRTLFELLSDARVANELTSLRGACADLFSAPVGRSPVLALVGHPDAASTTDRQVFRDLVGVPADTALTSSSWALWIFRELQAARATNEDSAPKRRTRKS